MLQPMKSIVVGMISGFCCEVDENCAPLGYYAACSGNFLPTFRGHVSVPSDSSVKCQK